MNNSKVLQYPMRADFLVICNGSQLQIQTHVMNQLTRSSNNSIAAELPMTIISVLGQPSSGKTAHVDAIMRHLQLAVIQHSGEFTGFADPKDFEHVDELKIDGILVSTPPFIVEDNDGRRAGVILLDVWNNGTMSEEVYMKLMDFCFYVSSIRIVIAGGPLRQISWWVRDDDPSISNRKDQRHWLSISNSLSKGQDGNEASGSYLIALNGGSSVRKLCRSVRDVDEGPLDICTSDFGFIMEQIFSPQSEALAWRLSDLGAHFEHGVAYVNNPQFTPEPELSAKPEEHIDLLATKMDGDPSDSVSVTLSPSEGIVTAAASSESESVSQYELVEAFTEHLYQTYAGSSELYLSSGELLQLLGQFQSQSNNAQLSNHRHFICVQKFYDTIQTSHMAINTEIAHRLESFSAEVENQFSFGTDSEVCQARQCIQHYRSRAHLIADEIATSVVTRLKLQELQLPRETDIFTFKLKTKIQQDIVNWLEYLEQQIKVCQAALAQHKQTLHRKLEHLVCISEENFKEAVMYSRSVLTQMVTGIFRPALQTAVVKAAENYESEQQLLLCNQQTFEAQYDFARTALSSSITVMEQLLTSHLQQHKIMTDKELSDAFDFLCTTVKKACSSGPEFSLKDAWEAAWKDLEPSVEKCLSKFRREIQNVFRKWDRELNSAIENSTFVYNQEMERRLPTYRLPAIELDKIHFECAQYAVEKFNVSSEVNEETINYWKWVLELSKLKEWKHGYIILNERKKLPTPPEQMPAAIDYGNSQAKLPDLPACHVGIYFGPEVVIFTALVPNGRQASSENSMDFPVTLEMKPYLAFSMHGEIIYGEQALKTTSRNRALFNIFSILAQLPEPTESSSLRVEINGQKVSLTLEAVAVLFFREAIKKLTEITGNRVQTCTVAHPGQLQDEATTVITDAIKIAGFSKVTLIPITTSLALSYVYPLLKRNSVTANERIEFVTVYYAGEILEISRIQMTGREPEVKWFGGCFDFRLQRKNEKHFTKLMRKYLEPKNLNATVLMLGAEDEDNVVGHDILIKVLGDLNCPRNQVTYMSAIAKAVADIDAGISANPHRSYQRSLSGDPKLPAAWHRKTLKAQVKNLVRLLDPGTPEPSPKKQKVINEEESKIAPEVGSLRYQLAQLVKRVEEALEKSSASKGPLYGFINQSVQQCHQLLQIATTSDMELTMAMNKLQIRSEDLLKELSEEKTSPFLG